MTLSSFEGFVFLLFRIHFSFSCRFSLKLWELSVFSGMAYTAIPELFVRETGADELGSELVEIDEFVLCPES